MPVIEISLELAMGSGHSPSLLSPQTKTPGRSETIKTFFIEIIILLCYSDDNAGHGDGDEKGEVV